MDEYALWLVQKTLHLFNIKQQFITKCAQWRLYLLDAGETAPIPYFQAGGGGARLP